MNRILAIGAFLLLSSASAIASDWVQVFTNPAEAISVDTDSIARSGDNINAWTRTVLTVETDVQLGRPAKEVRTQYIADCQGRTLLVNALMFYDAQGNVLRFSAAGARRSSGCRPGYSRRVHIACGVQ